MDWLPSSALCFLGAGSVSGILFTGLSQSRGLFGDFGHLAVCHVC